jgi:hypothetical protein
VSDKSGWEGRSQQFRDSRWGRRGLVPRPWTQPKKNRALEPLEGCIVWGCWELTREFPLKYDRAAFAVEKRHATSSFTL